MMASLQSKELDHKASEEEIAAFVDQVKAKRRNPDRLLPFLDYAHAIYRGRSKNATVRLRGYLLEAFVHVGLPTSAIPFVLEELESSISPYVVAAAAKALRGHAKPSNTFATYLLKAIKNIRLIDDHITFETYKPQWPREEHTTALEEILLTLSWLGDHAQETLEQLKSFEQDPYFSVRNKQRLRETIQQIEQSPVREDCCGMEPFAPSKRTGSYNAAKLSRVLLQDQDDRIVSYDQLFKGAVSVLLLFYTRCDNTNRCSRNVTRLGQLQQLIQEKAPETNARLVALTYNPEYDFSFRTRAYCTHRGFSSGNNSHVVRVTNGWEDLLNYLNPSVNYNDGLLNGHTTDLFILDKNGKVARRISGIEWENEKLIDTVLALHSTKTKPVGWINNFMSVAVSTLFVFFPKCPFCVAAYLSILGISQVQFFAIKAWMIPMLGAMLLINLVALFWMAWKRKWFLPFCLSFAGAAMAVASSLLKDELIFPAYTWIALMAAGSLLNGIPREVMRKIRWPKLRFYAIDHPHKKTSIQ